MRYLQITLGISWYVIALGGALALTYFPAVRAFVVPYIVVLSVIFLAMYAIHHLKLIK